MNRYLRKFVVALMTMVITAPVMAATETFVLDPGHTYVLWHINHFGFSNPSGKWMAEGTLVTDEKKPADSKLHVTIQVDKVDTGIPKLDEHLKGQDFFDTKKYPTATFVSDKVTVTGKDTAIVKGMLTLRGVTKPVTLKVKLNKIGVSPITNKKTAGFTAIAKLKRSDYGITAYLPGLGDEVKLEIEAEAAV